MAFGDAEGARSIGLTPEQTTPWLAMRRELPLVDVVVIGAQCARRKDVWSEILSDACLEARVPIYIARRDVPARELPVAVAWDASWAAGRAVRSGLPLLARAREIVLLQGPEGLTPRERDAGHPADLAAYLRREGATRASISSVPVAETGGAALLAAARWAGAGVLIAGAFGHGRRLETLFGGVTPGLLDGEGPPDLLLVH